MTLSGNFQELKNYFNKNHARPTNEWFEQKLQLSTTTTEINDFDKIFQQWLNEDWIHHQNDHYKCCLQSLPNELNLNLMNIKKQTFNGHYILQVEKIVDISRPLPIKNNDKSVDNNNDENEEEEEEENNNVNRKKSNDKNKNKNNQQQQQKKFFGYGKRLLQLLLTDGYQKCLAIEYESINDFPNDTILILNQKILLSGPFDVYMGIILLKNSNIKLLMKNIKPPPPPNHNNNNNNIDLNDMLNDCNDFDFHE